MMGNKKKNKTNIRLNRAIRKYLGHLRILWRRQDHRYGLRWRLLNVAVIAVVLAGIVIPIAQQLYQTNRYQLSADTTKLVGATNQALTKQLTYDGSRQLYQFNKAGVGNSSLPAAVQKASVGTPGSKDSSTYALDIPQMFSKGVTYHDVNSQLSFSLVPRFAAMDGKQVGGHLVFPLDGGNQAIYSLKGNGLKEDIVVPVVTSDSMTFSYTLNLPDTLQAKVIPNSNGAIGIYSADPSLFGNVTYGSSADEARVQKARAAADKNYLVFGLPAPVIKAVEGKSIGSATARFALNGNNLSVIAENLTSVQGPITIDPSVVVSSTSEFQTNGNNEGNIDFSTAGQINRSGLTGGSATAASWTTGTALGTSLSRMATVAYNGYIYCLGGQTGSITSVSYVQFAPLTSGAIGTWHYTHNSTDDGTVYPAGTGFTTARWGASAVAYNGYMYLMGGTTNGSAYLNDVQYAPINANGTIGTWHYTHNSIDDGATTQVSGFATNRAFMGAAAYNGYMYIYGGTTNGSAPTGDVQYASLNADGTIGTWIPNSSASLIGSGRYAFAGNAYNGYLYLIGGRDSGSIYASVQYAPINSDGTVGTWNTSTSFTTARFNPGGFVYNGYMYVIGGTSSGTTGFSDVQYAPVNANGTVGTWTTTTALTAARFATGAAAYNGYLYSVGGYNSAAQTASYYIKIDAAGSTGTFSNVTDAGAHNFTTARSLNCSVAYNGYLYVIGGSTNDLSGNIATVYYTALGANGALTAWNSTTSLPASVASAGCTVSNGYVYVLGGRSSSNAGVNTVYYAQLTSTGVIATNSGCGTAWCTSTNSLPVTAVAPGAVAYNGYLYEIGGIQNVDDTIVNYASLDISTGAVGTWTATSPLHDAANTAAVAMVGKYIYSMGGTPNSSSTSGITEVQYAAVNSNGTLGTWAVATASLPAARSFGSGVSSNGCVYSIGGEDTTGNSVSSVYFACPSSSGDITTLQSAPSLAAATTDSYAATYRGYIYLTGGFTTTEVVTTEAARINNGGSGDVGSWTAGTSFTTPRDGFGTFAYNGYMYILGGENSSGTALSDVQRASISSSGSLSTWGTTGVAALPVTLFGASTVVYNGYVYVIGGTSTPNSGNTSAVTYYAKINADGSLGDGTTTAGTWLTGSSINGAADGFGNPPNLMGATAYNGYLYVLGGNWCSNNCPTVQTQYAAINSSNGSPGAWTVSTSLPSGRIAGSSFAANGYVYMVGGFNSAEVATTYYAPLNSSTGAIGTWLSTVALPVARQNMTISYSNGYVYASGGYTGVSGGQSYNSNANTVFYAPVNTNGALGQWQTGLNAFSNTRSGAGSAIYNGYLYVVGGVGATEYADTQYASVQSISRTARYSKLVDFGAAVSLNSMIYTGTLPVTAAVPNPITVRAAGSSIVSFGSAIPAGSVSTSALSASCTQMGVSNTRYLWVSVAIDDSQNSIMSDANGLIANLADFTINYTPVHAKPNVRLRAGQTLQNGNLTGLDVCGP